MDNPRDLNYDSELKEKATKISYPTSLPHPVPTIRIGGVFFDDNGAAVNVAIITEENPKTNDGVWEGGANHSDKSEESDHTDADSDNADSGYTEDSDHSEDVEHPGKVTNGEPEKPKKETKGELVKPEQEDKGEPEEPQKEEAKGELKPEKDEEELDNKFLIHLLGEDLMRALDEKHDEESLNPNRKPLYEREFRPIESFQRNNNGQQQDFNAAANELYFFERQANLGCIQEELHGEPLNNEEASRLNSRGFDPTIRRPGTIVSEIVREIKNRKEDEKKKAEEELAKEEMRYRNRVLFFRDTLYCNLQDPEIFLQSPPCPPNTPSGASPSGLSPIPLNISPFGELLGQLLEENVDPDVIEKFKRMMACGLPQPEFFLKMNSKCLRVVFLPIIKYLPESFWPLIWDQDKETKEFTFELLYADCFKEVRTMAFNAIVEMAGKRVITVDELNQFFERAERQLMKRFYK